MNPIREARIARGLTLEQLAAACGTSKSTVQRWENGTIPRGTVLGSLARALEVGVAELVAWFGESSTAIPDGDGLAAHEEA